MPGQPILLPDGVLAIDVLAIGPPCRDDGRDDLALDDDRVVLRVGEIKSYPDRGGYTDTGDLATSRAQAGAYHHALELALDDLGLAIQLRVYPYGFLVLTRAASSAPWRGCPGTPLPA